MKITISMDEEGRFSIDMTEGLPLFVAIGALSVAQSMLINSDSVVMPNELEAEFDEEDVQ